METKMQLSKMSDSDILLIANPIMDNLMDASTNIDYERHVRDFTDRAKSTLSKDLLEYICKEYQRNKGFFKHRELVAIFRRPESVAIVWKQLFTIHPGEFVAELVLVQENDKFLVDHVMVL